MSMDYSKIPTDVRSTAQVIAPKPMASVRLAAVSHAALIAALDAWRIANPFKGIIDLSFGETGGSAGGAHVQGTDTIYFGAELAPDVEAAIQAWQNSNPSFFVTSLTMAPKSVTTNGVGVASVKLADDAALAAWLSGNPLFAVLSVTQGVADYTVVYLTDTATSSLVDCIVAYYAIPADSGSIAAEYFVTISFYDYTPVLAATNDVTGGAELPPPCPCGL
jgi:hypothetical protein